MVDLWKKELNRKPEQGKKKTENKVPSNLFVTTNYLERKRQMKSELRGSIFKRKPSAQTAVTKVSLINRDIPLYEMVLT